MISLLYFYRFLFLELPVVLSAFEDSVFTFLLLLVLLLVLLLLLRLFTLSSSTGFPFMLLLLKLRLLQQLLGKLEALKRTQSLSSNSSFRTLPLSAKVLLQEWQECLE